MIGQTLTRKAGDKARFIVTAYDEAHASYVLTPVEFGAAIAVSPDGLSAFSGVPRNPKPDAATDEPGGWRKLADAFERASHKRKTPGANGLLTPEEVLSGAAAERAKQIAADSDLLSDFAVGLLPVSPEVAAYLDDLVAAQAARDA